MICVHCKEPISGTYIGAGDGTGQKFAHELCYYKHECVRLEKENKRLNHELSNLTWKSNPEQMGR